MEELLSATREHSAILQEGNQNMDLGIALAELKLQIQHEMRRSPPK